MLEVEAKFRAKLDDVRERVKALGFSLIGVSEEVDIYFQHPCRDFSATDEALRLRLSAGEAQLTYKGPRMGAGAKTRFEASAAAGPEVVEVLKQLGFREVAQIRKRREYYSGGGFTISLDWVEGVGEFVEIEKLVPDGSSVEAAVAEIKSLAESLGLRDEVRETYLELFLRRGITRKVF
ncbi:MAG: class IV adenylate cyclase [Pyrobaculum sp.]